MIIWSLPENGGLWGEEETYGSFHPPQRGGRFLPQPTNDHMNEPAGKKLEHQDAQGPEVNTEVVAFVEDYLWGHVLGRAAEGPGLLATSDLLSKTKVDLEKQRLQLTGDFEGADEDRAIQRRFRFSEGALTSLMYPSPSSMRFSGFRSL